ncbi:MAG: riboflavin synthase [Myxococcota bacterium]|nr:riboflavin synthase [Myxococcota bacterium]
MFTGLVESLGRVTSATGNSPRRLEVQCDIPPAEVQLGDSIAIDGCCLTVVSIGRDSFAFEAATETLERTTIGKLKVGDRVNLERALRMGDRLGGHLVAGHVDGVGTVKVREQRGSALYLGIELPEEVARITVPRGSVTYAGVSLTVTDVEDRVAFVGLIPHTLEVTTLNHYQVGDPMNVEGDLIGRYVEKLLLAQNTPGSGGLTIDYLKDKGFA